MKDYPIFSRVIASAVAVERTKAQVMQLLSPPLYAFNQPSTDRIRGWIILDRAN
ncbi:MAG: hypothetical protein MK080_10985 [Opitutales bacterium]|nr:hypothetical protein [Opitutales bacterium]NRA27996.1 hypothetical protein [Opitutales bacterium]